jgi:ferric-dicitrate binding protein FerR (iron transport regulator)
MGKERVVEITGEAYFEVAANPKMPFKVTVNHKAEIEVLGTHFNVNAYVNEVSLNTTLLEGSVLINNGTEKAILKPGQQAQVTQAIKIVRDADIDKIMAWKNGYFNFEGMNLREVMQQLERWYDIEVVYENNVPDVRFYGELSRDLNLSGIIAALKDSDVHFRIEGKKLIVLP